MPSFAGGEIIAAWPIIGGGDSPDSPTVVHLPVAMLAPGSKCISVFVRFSWQEGPREPPKMMRRLRPFILAPKRSSTATCRRTATGIEGNGCQAMLDSPAKVSAKLLLDGPSVLPAAVLPPVT